MPHKYNEKMFDIKHLRETAEKLKNWGRWGPDDEIGTLNFITPETVSYTHLRAHETKANLVCRLLLEKNNKKQNNMGQPK